MTFCSYNFLIIYRYFFEEIGTGMFFSKIIFNFFFWNLLYSPGSGSQLGQNPGSGSKFNVFGSTTLVGRQWKTGIIKKNPGKNMKNVPFPLVESWWEPLSAPCTRNCSPPPPPPPHGHQCLKRTKNRVKSAYVIK